MKEACKRVKHVESIREIKKSWKKNSWKEQKRGEKNRKEQKRVKEWGKEQKRTKTSQELRRKWEKKESEGRRSAGANIRVMRKGMDKNYAMNNEGKREKTLKKRIRRHYNSYGVRCGCGKKKEKNAKKANTQALQLLWCEMWMWKKKEKDAKKSKYGDITTSLAWDVNVEKKRKTLKKQIRRHYNSYGVRWRCGKKRRKKLYFINSPLCWKLKNWIFDKSNSNYGLRKSTTFEN